MLNGPPPRPGDPAARDRALARDWVVVVGMHRSGTSAVAGLLAGLGLHEPHAADLMTGHPGNPNHHESISLSAFDEALLAALGGSWSAPPRPAPDWEAGARGDEWARAAADVVVRAFPDSGPAVVKDPRMCLLLPFWAHVLGRPLRAVLTWRSPREVARSVARLSGGPAVHGLALWEAYNREALLGLAGHDVLVTSYDAVLSDPAAFARTAAGWLDGAGIPGMTGLDPDGAARAPDAGLRHESGAAGPDLHVLPEQEELGTVLTGLAGHHRRFVPPALAPLSPWTEGLLELRRDFEAAHRQVRSRVELEAELGRLGLAYTGLVDHLRSSGVTAPASPGPVPPRW